MLGVIVDVFADDINFYMEMKTEYLWAVLDYLDTFSKISGLKCNLDKN